MNIEEYIHTPFGMIKKPEKKPEPIDDKKPHWLFEHMFDEKGNVK